MNAKSRTGRLAAIDKLNSWKFYRLALLVAPAGAGKTDLLRTWTRKMTESEEEKGPQIPEQVRVAWVDLGHRDNDPGRFLSSLATALGTAGFPGMGLVHGFKQEKELEASSDVVDFEPQTGEKFEQIELGMIVFANAMARLQVELILVLDHYDYIREPAIHAAMSQLVDYTPPNFHMVIACREEPPLPLPRLRARRQMVDILASDLENYP